MDNIFIRDIPSQAIIGVNSFERIAPQKLVISIELKIDIREAAKNDDIKLALNYDEICNFADSFVRQSEYQLIEALAENLASEILATFNCEQIKLSIKKPSALKATQNVGVEITRNKNDIV